jgi:hypothetical protein
MPTDPPVAVGGVTVGAVDGRVVGEVGCVDDVVVVEAPVVVVVDGALVVGVCAPTVVAVLPKVATTSATTRTTRTPRRVEARCTAPPGEEAKRTGYRPRDASHRHW